MRVIVLGAGRVGATIALDLAADPSFEVTVADRSPDALAVVVDRAPGMTARQVDLSVRDELEEAIRDHALVVGALPSVLGYRALESVIAGGKNCVDISFLEEDPLVLHDEARRAGVTVVVDCGVAPGLSNLLLGRAVEVFDRVERFDCMVGGLPANRVGPWEYKAPFSPSDALAEYTRPARLRRDGQQVVKPALSDLEEVEFDGLGTLEAFNTDGLRTLLDTVSVPNMSEKTLRYPGYASKIALLRDSGFLSPVPVALDRGSVSPLALTSELLFEQWHLDPGEPDLTAMRISIEGLRDGVPDRLDYELLDHFDTASNRSSMARTTGFTCTATARVVADRTFERPGVSALEHVGRSETCYRRILADLVERGVRVREV